MTFLLLREMALALTYFSSVLFLAFYGPFLTYTVPLVSDHDPFQPSLSSACPAAKINNDQILNKDAIFGCKLCLIITFPLSTTLFNTGCIASLRTISSVLVTNSRSFADTRERHIRWIRNLSSSCHSSQNA